MKSFSMKMAVGVAVVAAIFGAGTVGIGVEQVQNAWRPVVAVATVGFVAYFLMKMLQIMQVMKSHMKWIADKCNYIEKRMDAAAAKSGDICRHLQQIFLEFNAEQNEGKTLEVKHWWVERRLRSLYEDFSNSKAMQKCSFEVVKKAWSMLQLEVKLRTLRDVVSWRHFGADYTEDDDDMEHCLKNMQTAFQYCSLWKPMELRELEQHEVQSIFEDILMAQIAERVKEVKQYIEIDGMQKYGGLQLESMFAASSSQ